MLLADALGTFSIADEKEPHPLQCCHWHLGRAVRIPVDVTRAKLERDYRSI